MMQVVVLTTEVSRTRE